VRSARLPLRACSGRMLSRCSWPTSICGPELRAASRPPLDQDSRTLNYLDIQKTVLSVHASLFRAIIGLCAVTMVDRPPPNLQARCSSHKHGGARLITRRPLSGSSRECLWFAAKTGGRAIPRRHIAGLGTPERISTARIPLSNLIAALNWTFLRGKPATIRSRPVPALT
jgi:hypothetical protein